MQDSATKEKVSSKWVIASIVLSLLITGAAITFYRNTGLILTFAGLSISWYYSGKTTGIHEALKLLSKIGNKSQ